MNMMGARKSLFIGEARLRKASSKQRMQVNQFSSNPWAADCHSRPALLDVIPLATLSALYIRYLKSIITVVFLQPFIFARSILR